MLSKLRAKMGLDRVKVAATGASAIAPDALAFMLGLGIPVLEVWGMSETSAVVTMNPPDAIRIGTVGKVVPGGTEISLAEDGQTFALTGGTATGDADCVVVDFTGTMRVAAYASFFPPAGQWVELVDPSLSIASDGTGTWSAGVRTGVGAAV